MNKKKVKKEEEEGEKEAKKELHILVITNKQTKTRSLVNWSVAHLPTSYKNQPHQIGVVGYKLRSPEYPLGIQIVYILSASL